MAEKSVLNEVAEERAKQDRKWGEQNHDNFRWLAILGEEVGEANEAALEIEFVKEQVPGDWKAQLRKELIQVAAVAVGFIECIDRRETNEFLDSVLRVPSPMPSEVQTKR